MEIKIFTAYDKKTKSFEELMKTKWSDDFVEDFQWEHISDHKDAADFDIYLAFEGDEVLWWLIVWERNILNNFKDPIKTARKYELQKSWYKNLTYVIVDSNSRSKWIASRLLSFATQNNDLLWLTCIDELIPFYIKNGFALHMKRIDWEKVNLMTYSK